MRWRIPGLIILGGLLLRVVWILSPAGAPDGDEATFGLMALHILDGREYPIYLWGAHYAGAVVSYMAAGVFWLWGVSEVTLKLSALPFAAGYLAVTFCLARAILDERSARVALLFAALPPAIPLDYSVKVTGGFAETLCFGGLTVLMAFCLPMTSSASWMLRGQLVLLGFFAGFGFYIFPLTLPYVTVAAFFLLRHRRPILKGGGWLWVLGGGLLGISPMLVYNAQFRFATLLRLGSRVFGVSRAEALDPGADLGAAAGWIVLYLADLPTRLTPLLHSLASLLGLSAGGGLLVVLALGAGATLALWFTDRSTALSADAACKGRYCVSLLPAIFLFVWLTGLNRPRHLVALYSVLPLGLAALYGRIRAFRVWPAHAFLATLLFAAGWDLLQAARIPSGVALTPLIQESQQLGIRGMYSDYEVAYRLMFASHETILISPTAWSRDVISDRTPQITRQVDSLPNPAYVFRRNSAETAWFAQGLARRGVTSNRLPAGPLELFSDLSRPIRSTEFPVGPAW